MPESPIKSPSNPTPSLHRPSWVTAELLADTLHTWQPFYTERLTEEDALEILLNAGQLLELLELTDD